MDEDCINPNRALLQFLTLPSIDSEAETEDILVDLRQCAMIIMALLDKMAAPHLPRSSRGPIEIYDPVSIHCAFFVFLNESARKCTKTLNILSSHSTRSEGRGPLTAEVTTFYCSLMRSGNRFSTAVAEGFAAVSRKPKYPPA